METNIILNSTAEIMTIGDLLKTTTAQINERIVDDDNDNNNMLVLNRHQGDSLRNFPKIELHAHLNGCIRETTLFDLAKERGIHLNDQYFSSSSSNADADADADLDATMEGTGSRHNKQRHRSLKECFIIFAEIGKVVVDLDAIRQITREALEDFAKEGVVYLELRSTPKRLLLTKKLLCCGDTTTSRTGTFSLSDIATDKLATKRQYCETIIYVLIKFRKEEEERYKKESEKLKTSSTTTSSSSDVSTKAVIIPRLPMIASFIVSIDRSNPVESGFEHVDLAIELAKEYPGVVVGVGEFYIITVCTKFCDNRMMWLNFIHHDTHIYIILNL
jgi:adenosine deaminase